MEWILLLIKWQPPQLCYASDCNKFQLDLWAIQTASSIPSDTNIHTTHICTYICTYIVRRTLVWIYVVLLLFVEKLDHVKKLGGMALPCVYIYLLRQPKALVTTTETSSTIYDGNWDREKDIVHFYIFKPWRKIPLFTFTIPEIITIIHNLWANEIFRLEFLYMCILLLSYHVCSVAAAIVYYHDDTIWQVVKKMCLFFSEFQICKNYLEQVV